MCLCGRHQKITDIFTGMAGELDDFAESFGTSDDGLEGQIAAPLVNALDSISAIVNGATEKVMEMSLELLDGNE